MIDLLVVVEYPYPWPPKIETVPLFAELLVAFREQFHGWRVRVLAALPTEEPRTLSIFWRPPSDTIGPYQAATIEIATEHGPLLSGEEIVDACLTQMADPQPLQPFLLVCTHGERDRCCGTKGPLLAASLQEKVGHRVHVRQVSHIGGHRFPPTVLSFPEGMSWAFTAVTEVENFLHTGMFPANALLRGALSARTAQRQVADIAVLHAEPDLKPTDTRTCSDHDTFPTQDGHHPIRVEIQTKTGTFMVDVYMREMLPEPVCGSPEESSKFTRRWEARLLSEPEPLPC